MMMVKRDGRENIEDFDPEEEQNSSQLLNQTELAIITDKMYLATENIGRIELLPDTQDKRFMLDGLQEGLFDLRIEVLTVSSILAGKLAEIERAIETTDVLSTKLKRKEYRPVINLIITDTKEFRMYEELLGRFNIITTDELFEAMTNEYPIHDELFSELKRSDTVFLTSKLIELNYKFPE
jgi:hypothetical protein